MSKEKPSPTHFGSDNVTGIAPAIMDAIVAANAGGVHGYGEDSLTEAMEKRFAEIFETEVKVMPVGTGSIANGLSLATVTPPWGEVFCHEGAHINVDEANGPEFFTGGAKLHLMPGENGKITAEALRAAATRYPRADVHNPLASTVSITQATEVGTLYAVDEVRAIGAVAKDEGLAFHMDGARFANAVAALGCAPADLTWRAGVDVLSFGATKNGCLAVEGIVLFNPSPERADRLNHLHKRAGQLYSKMRFFSAQLDAYLDDGNWLAWAKNANRQAKRLADGLGGLNSVTLAYPVEGNEVFCRLPRAAYDAVVGAGIGTYPLYGEKDGVGSVRFVCAFNTEDAHVDDLIGAIASAI
jgi:threonine aldolase